MYVEQQGTNRGPHALQNFAGATENSSANMHSLRFRLD